MYTVYGMADSGNCYKVKLALEQLARPYRWVEVDSTKGGTRTREFLARNPNGKVPTLQLEDGGYLPPDSARRAELPRLVERGRQALAVMEQHLAKQPYFAGAAYSIADISLYAYTHCARDGGFDLQPFAQVRAWLERVRAQPGHVPLG